MSNKEDYLKIGDIVLFCSLPAYGCWKKGKIVSNNFAMCNLPDFFDKPQFYVSELDENDNVIEDKKSIGIDNDSKYLVKFKPGMEWCIGKNCKNNTPTVRDFEQEEKNRIGSLKKNLNPFDKIIVRGFGSYWHTDWFECYLNKEKTQIRTARGFDILNDEDWEVYECIENNKKYKDILNLDDDLVKKDYHIETCNSFEVEKIETIQANCKNPLEQFYNVTFEDYLKIPGIKEAAEKDEQWKKEIEEKLDNILNTLNLIYLGWAPLRTTTYPDTRPIEPYYNPYNPTTTDPYNPERWKIYCDHSKDNNYVGSIPITEYNNYCSTTTNANVNSEFSQTCLDSNIDTYGLYKANNNLKDNE